MIRVLIVADGMVVRSGLERVIAQTGRFQITGAVSHAEGVMSLGRAFMAAGAESVTVSLWEVSDESTQLFMQEYYNGLLGGKSKAEALSIARSFLFADKRFTNPFYWAPFILIGD